MQKYGGYGLVESMKWSSSAAREGKGKNPEERLSDE